MKKLMGVKERIKLLNSVNSAEKKKFKVLFIMRPYLIDPLGIAYLSSSIKQHGHETDILLVKENDFLEKICQYIYDYKPDVLAYSITTGSHNYFVDLNKGIRRFFQSDFKNYKPMISVFGGSHCTYFPEIKNEDYVDVIFQGESEETFSSFLNNIKIDKKQKTIYIGKGIYKPQVVDVNNIPFPDRELIYKFEKNRDNPIKNIITSRGCPYACGYCLNSVYKEIFGDTKLRYRKISSVICEARRLFEKYPKTKMIFFEDDEFISNTKRLEEFASLWKRLVDKPYHCQLRIEHLTEYKVHLLKNSGCLSVTFAIECGNEEYRNIFLQRKVSNKDIINGSKLLNKHKIPFRTENMLCLPSESIKKALETLDLNIKCKPTIGWASLYQPYPKTPMGEMCRRENLYTGNLDDIPTSFFEKTVLNIPEKQKKEFQNLQRLFTLIVRYPILRIFIRLLIKFQNNKFYDTIYSRLKVFLYDKKLYNIGEKNGK